MHVVLSLDPGGTERLVIEITRALAPSVDSVVCCLDHRGEWASQLADIGVPVLSLQRGSGFRPKLGYDIARLARLHNVEVLHCHHYTPFVYGQLAALLRRNLHVVFTEHGRLSDAGPSLKRRLVNPLLGRLPDAIFAVSADLRRHMIAEALPAGRVQVIHNGIAIGEPPSAAARLAARQFLRASRETLVIGTIGRLDPVKDFSTLLRSVALLRQSHPPVCLLLIGDGPERHRLQEEAVTLGIADAVTFAGYRGDARELLAGADIYTNSSIHEGISLTILEAMAAALPVVATRVGGNPEVVLHEETGLLVSAREPAALANAFQRLALTAALRQRMGDAGRLRASRHFSLESMTAQYLQAYRNALAD